MIKLDILKAKYGDCLLLQGGQQSPVRILIDGGPAKTFQESLQPRLKALAKETQDDVAPLIDLILVSHIDSDHIAGLIKLLEHEETVKSEGGQSLARFQDLWHNSFLDLIPDVVKPINDGNGSSVSAASLFGEIDAQLDHHLDSSVVVASVGQGNTLTELSRFHRLNRNAGADDTVMRQGMRSSDYFPFQFHVLGPKEKEIAALRKTWIKKMKEIREKKAGAKEQAVRKLDSSVANLSSIVVMAEAENLRLLLTGDARGDFVLKALADEGFVQDGVCAVDVFKWPHHGSIKNLPKGLFKTVIADHHVISADGRHHNPDVESIELFIREHEASQQTTLHMTYGPDELEPEHGKAIQQLIDDAKADGHQISLNSISAGQPPWLSLSFT